MKRFSEKALAIFKRANFERCGLQKYEHPTNDFCLIENFGEYFSEIKSPSNLNRFCHFERRDVISQICFTSTIYKFSRVQSSMIELFSFIVICTADAALDFVKRTITDKTDGNGQRVSEKFVRLSPFESV